MENIGRRLEEGEKRKKYGVVGFSSGEERHMELYTSLLLFTDNQKFMKRSHHCLQYVPTKFQWTVPNPWSHRPSGSTRYSKQETKRHECEEEICKEKCGLIGGGGRGQKE